MSQSDRVTDLIMHYYLEHGRNRDLEKYLRLRRMSNATRSSSDGSLPGLDELQRKAAGCPNRSGLGKSMENLSTLRKKAEQQELSEGEKSLRNASAESAKVANKSTEQTDDKVGTASDAKGVTVKEKKTEQKSGRNFNFNLESVIEINLPPPPSITMTTPAMASAIAPITYMQPAALPPQMPSAGREEPARIVVHENSTQTAATEDDPIRPVVKAQAPGTGEETLDSLKDISPVSSIASNKQKLEWDSLGDIGYDSSERLQLCGAADLNETEKRCLQRYFARKGLNFDRSVVVVRQREEKDKKSRPDDGSIMLQKPGAQSTPKPLQSQLAMAREEAQKSTQTSLRARVVESRGIQASDCNTESERSHHHPSREDKAVGTAESYTLASVDAAESFEFFSPSVPATENNTPSGAASVSTPVHSSSTASSSTGNNSAPLDVGNRSQQRPTFDDEVKLGLTLYNSICELQSMPTGVKESLIDKIFRKLSRHDPKKRTREQLLCDYAESVRKRHEKEVSKRGQVEDNVYDDVGTSGDKADKSEESVQQDRSCGAEVEVIEETISPQAIAGSVDVSVGLVKGSSTGSNEAKNVRHDSTAREHGSMEISSHRTGSSLVESIGTTKENVPRKLSAPEARDRRVRKAMQEYLKPMTHSEVEYENLRDLKRLNQQRANEPQLAQIDRAIEQLLVKKMLLLHTGETVPVKDPVQAEPLPTQLPSERSGTSVYTSVHEAVSVNSSAKESSSGWNSHYHMAKALKNRSKLETPTADTPSPPSDVSIPTFIKQKKEKFVENYDQVRQRRAFEEQNHIYTRPYSSSGQRNGAKRRPQEKENHNFGKDKYVLSKLSKGTANDRRAPSSSNNSIMSPQFISSDSISIPVVTTLTNTTTTHHYDIKSRRPSPPIATGRTAGTQTTDSILRTKPIFGEPKPKASSATAAVQVPSTIDVRKPDYAYPVTQCHCPCGQLQQQASIGVRTGFDDNSGVRRRTEIIDGTGAGWQDKQAQTQPSAIAYVITFEGGMQRKPAAAVPTPTPSPRSSSVSSNDDSDPENGKDKDSEKLLTLREQFRRSCPATLSKIEQRRQCINELNKLRSKRNQQRQRLLLLTSDDSLRKTSSMGRGKLPPPPLSQRRVFASTRAMRESTRQKVRNLPEVQRKKEIERFNNLKRKNLIMKDVYNKNLQRKVLRGQVDLSNSVRVIQD
ncbi:AGAP013115-PA-like protein [Anopheles sinensis]|uniref:AGAP013115-PA-like protein n=1 Tax=Anopheles sinensis TaxID=74873 RepID=A0A084VXP7_ANOSI|nr:AGAP013115-PA-like protein [Anopheles sinensis]